MRGAGWGGMKLLFSQEGMVEFVLIKCALM